LHGGPCSWQLIIQEGTFFCLGHDFIESNNITCDTPRMAFSRLKVLYGTHCLYSAVASFRFSNYLENKVTLVSKDRPNNKEPRAVNKDKPATIQSSKIYSPSWHPQWPLILPPASPECSKTAISLSKVSTLRPSATSPPPRNSLASYRRLSVPTG
jgi:hypothetical protein